MGGGQPPLPRPCCKVPAAPLLPGPCCAPAARLHESRARQAAEPLPWGMGGSGGWPEAAPNLDPKWEGGQYHQARYGRPVPSGPIWPTSTIRPDMHHSGAEYAARKAPASPHALPSPAGGSCGGSSPLHLAGHQAVAPGSGTGQCLGARLGEGACQGRCLPWLVLAQAVGVPGRALPRRPSRGLGHWQALA